jgi:hypothetical protein
LRKREIFVIYCGSCKNIYLHRHKTLPINYACQICGQKRKPRLIKQTKNIEMIQGIVYANERSIAGQNIIKYAEEIKKISEKKVEEKQEPTLIRKIIGKIGEILT